MPDIVDVAIVGSGPAGLAAACRIVTASRSLAVIESGKSVRSRDRHTAEDMTRGHGGAGLFSDGKFSFYPSASKLWLLPREEELREAYDWTCGLLRTSGLDTPPFPETPVTSGNGTEEWTVKEYPSEYLSLSSRLWLTQMLADELGKQIRTESEMVKASYDEDEDLFHLELRDSKGETLYMNARRLLFATGRFGPLGLQGLTRQWVFRRLEVGFRVEQPSERAFFRDMEQLDPKLQLRDENGDIEWRTFCVCRDGEAVLTETQGLWTVSGRADCPPTGKSNLGFNTRVLNEEAAARTSDATLTAMAEKEAYFAVPLLEFLAEDSSVLEDFDSVYGEELRGYMQQGLRRLVEAFPEVVDDKTVIKGPTLEGVGWYPQVDGELRLLDLPAWVAGDACGLFRGIVAAMISGHYAASSVLDDLGLRA